MNIHQDHHDAGETKATYQANQLIGNHQEAIVITLDPDQDNPGESKIGVFTKLASTGSRLSAVLEQILVNLRRTRDDKSRSSSFKNPPSGPSQEHNCEGPKDSADCCEAICRQGSRPA